MRLNKPCIIRNPNGETYTLPIGTKLQPLGKLLWDCTPQGPRAVYSIHTSERRKIPSAFAYSANGCWFSGFHTARWNDAQAQAEASNPVNHILRKPLVADGSRSINRF